MSSFKSLGISSVREPCDYVNSLALIANTPERQALPSGYNYLTITSTRNVYVKFGNSGVTASVPDDVSDGTASELNGGTWMLSGQHTHISIVPELDCRVTLSFYKVV